MAQILGTVGPDFIDENYLDDPQGDVPTGDPDTIFGDPGNDTIFGLGGDDVINGAQDDDTLIGGAGADDLFGGTGTDTASYITSSGGVKVSLADGVGSFSDAEGDTLNLIEKLIGSELGDILEGDSSANTLEGRGGDDILEGGGGGDLLIGGDGSDWAAFVSFAVGVTASLLSGFSSSGAMSGIENLFGSDFADTLTGDDSANAILGNDGADLLRGEFGDDHLIGEAGNDTLEGGGGADRMSGGIGDDLFRVDLTDRIDENGGSGTDTVEAFQTFSLANTTVIVGGDFENLTLIGSADINGTGNPLNNLIIGNSGANTLKGGGGADTLQGRDGDDTYFVGDLNDIFDETNGNGLDTVVTMSSFSLASGQVIGAVENLFLLEDANIDGTGNGLANRIMGNAGRNVLSGLGGDDLIFGLGRKDVIDGGAGKDVMRGGFGNDTYRVETVGDRAIEKAGQGTDRVLSSVSLKLGGNVEKLILTGSDNLKGTGNGLANTISGNGGANALNGGAGNDLLFGNAGKDVLTGALGRDVFNGGAGADRFDFNVTTETPGGAGRDIIQGFSRAQGDRIDLATIDADTSANPGNDAFTFIGAGAFGGGGGELRFAAGVVQGDINGDRLADFEIRVFAGASLLATDFIL